jgi:hypothetical protein
VTDLFVTGAGFGIYLNNRTWLEGWDIELAFKRMARRLAKAAIAWILPLALCLTGVSPAAEPATDPTQVIREVKADSDFKIHTVKEKIPTPRGRQSPPGWLKWLRFSGDTLAVIGAVLKYGALLLIAGLVILVIWKNRHVFRIAKQPDNIQPRARVVVGMEVSPETLPADVPGTAWNLWREGRRHEALALLYRGSISAAIEMARVEIQESDTEGDCLRRVTAADGVAHPEYFRGITMAWMRMAYAGSCPEDREVEELCRHWPFVERRAA